MINNLSSNYANTVAPFAPLGRQVVGQESSELKSSSFKALEQSADSARSENRRSPEDRPNEQGEAERVRGGDQQVSAQAVSVVDKNTVEKSAVEKGTVNKGTVEKERLAKEQKLINELAARDREVHAHEQAHAAVAGQYAGTITYQFVKGPDGLSYAVGGEVSIDTGAVVNDPEATLRKAQQIRMAANAPADPSPQDRRVAAEAAQMESEARAELNLKNVVDAQVEQRRLDEKTEVQKLETDQEAATIDAERKKAKEEQENQDAIFARRHSESTDILLGLGKTNINISQRLVEIGAIPGSSAIGTFLNQEV
ncbi:MAG: catalase [Moraxellaceae bacterium]|nr:MAG: catalase [Moraxellaceae bacterium]